HHSGPAEGIQGIVGESAFADIAANPAGAIVGGKAREAHRARLHAADAGSEGVFAAHRPGDDFLEIHAHVLEEVLGKVAAMEADGLVGIVAVVVVPVEQGAGRFRGEAQGVHGDGAADVDFAGAGNQVVAHHAHDGAGDDAEVFFEGGPAL